MSLASIAPLVAWVAVWCLVMWGGLLLLMLVPGGLQRWARVLVIAGALVLWGGALFLNRKCSNPIMLRLLRCRVLRLGIPICTRCGYEPGSWTDRCPECGRPIRRPVVAMDADSATSDVEGVKVNSRG